MSQTSLYLRQYVLEQVLLGANHPSPAVLYLALFTTAPTAAGPGTEVLGGAYARQSITWSLDGTAAAITAKTVDNAVNAAILTFPNATVAWGRVTHWAVMDALSGGNLFYYGEVSLSRDIAVGNTQVVPVANLRIDMSGATT